MSMLATTLKAGVLVSVSVLSLRIAEVGKTDIRNKDFMKKSEISFRTQQEIVRKRGLTLKPLLIFFNRTNQQMINGSYEIVEVKKIGSDATESDVQISDRRNIRRIELSPAERNKKYAEIDIIHREEERGVTEERTTHEILSVREEVRNLIKQGQSNKRFIVEVFNKISDGTYEIYKLELQRRITPVYETVPLNQMAQTKSQYFQRMKADVKKAEVKSYSLELKEVMAPGGKVVRGATLAGEAEFEGDKVTRVYASVETADGKFSEITPGITKDTKAHQQFAYMNADGDTAGMASGAFNTTAMGKTYYLYFSSGPYKGYRLKYELSEYSDEFYERKLREEENLYAMESQSPEYSNDVAESGYTDDYLTEADVEEVNDRQVAAVAGRNQLARGMQRLRAEDGIVEENFGNSPDYSYVNNRIDALYQKAETDIDSLSDAELEVLANLEEIHSQGSVNFSR